MSECCRRLRKVSFVLCIALRLAGVRPSGLKKHHCETTGFSWKHESETTFFEEDTQYFIYQVLIRELEFRLVIFVACCVCVCDWRCLGTSWTGFLQSETRIRRRWKSAGCHKSWRNNCDSSTVSHTKQGIIVIRANSFKKKIINIAKNIIWLLLGTYSM